ncbi:hypothetical protein F4778DRAFT_732124 [Xylariomycetidae sp. FL2044]|nr:hypothetical protein F4778DRAFT_732124 [Xylariomycetidae sp. FL2044]
MLTSTCQSTSFPADLLSTISTSQLLLLPSTTRAHHPKSITPKSTTTKQTMAQSTQTHIPLFYHVLFTWIDPLSCLYAIYLCWTVPETMLGVFAAGTSVTYTPELFNLFVLIASSFMLTGLFSGILLRYTQDVAIWKITQLAVWLVDVEIMVGQYVALRNASNLTADPGLDLSGFFAALGAIFFLGRTLFLLGVGVKTSKLQKRAA